MSRTAASTLAITSSLTGAERLSAADAVDMATPARFATSLMVAIPSSRAFSRTLLPSGRSDALIRNVSTRQMTARGTGRDLGPRFFSGRIRNVSTGGGRDNWERAGGGAKGGSHA